jgi:hypothetical protein
MKKKVVLMRRKAKMSKKKRKFRIKIRRKSDGLYFYKF